jgi:hypothetical protein
MQNDIKNPYLQKSAEAFKTDVGDMLIFRLGNLMPFLVRPLHAIVYGLTNVRQLLIKLIPILTHYIEEIPTLWLLNRVKAVLDLRRKSTSNLKKRVDLLQIMIENSTEEKVTVSCVHEDAVDILIALISIHNTMLFTFLG